jgi:hypothetical protein
MLLLLRMSSTVVLQLFHSFHLSVSHVAVLKAKNFAAKSTRVDPDNQADGMSQ